VLAESVQGGTALCLWAEMQLTGTRKAVRALENFSPPANGKQPK
jgi:hypothetical protein